MNLPRLHERYFVVKKAESFFNEKVTEEIFVDAQIRIDESINIFSQCISNLTKSESDKVIIGDLHQKVEMLLKEIEVEYDITYGEIVEILASRVKSDAEYVIRWERQVDS